MSYPDPSHPSNYYGKYSGGYVPQYGSENERQLHSTENQQPALKRPRNSIHAAFNNDPRVNPMLVGNNGGLGGSNKGTGSGNIFFKTRICTKFKEGTCWNKDTCTFAHGLDDLRKPHPNWKDIAGEKCIPGLTTNSISNSNTIGDNNDTMTHHVKICMKYYNNDLCPYGDNCKFLHKRPSHPPAINNGNYQRESSVMSIGTTGVGDSLKYWKTRLCIKWESGECPYGDGCSYAHGVAELRADSRLEDVKGHSPVPILTAKPVSYSPMAQANVVKGVPSTTATITTTTTETDERALRWKPNKKINQIYGDWLEDL